MNELLQFVTSITEHLLKSHPKAIRINMKIIGTDPETWYFESFTVEVLKRQNRDDGDVVLIGTPGVPLDLTGKK